MTLEDFILRAVGVPFLWKGRDYGGWDCWGLVWVAYRDVFHVKLPCYSNRYDRPEDSRCLVELFHEGKEEWEQSGNPEDGNVAIIFRFGDMLHTGIVILGGSQILHVQEGLETVHEPISRFHVEGIYRRPEGER